MLWRLFASSRALLVMMAVWQLLRPCPAIAAASEGAQDRLWAQVKDINLGPAVFDLGARIRFR